MYQPIQGAPQHVNDRRPLAPAAPHRLLRTDRPAPAAPYRPPHTAPS